MKKFNILQRNALFKVCSKKSLRIMKLSTILLFVTVFNVFGSITYSQKASLNLDMKDVTIKAVLDVIESQSEFFFLYSSKMIDVNKKVDINVADRNVTEVLDELLTGTNIKYSVRDKQVLLFNKEADVSIILQQNGITGRVTDEKGIPLPGVTVLVKGTTLGALTDVSGKYILTNLPNNPTLIFSFVGYASQEITSDGRKEIEVVLKELAIGLNEVVVIGYGTQKKVNLTGAVDVVNEKQIGMRAVTNVTNALQGISPNLNITEGAFSGEPGGKMILNIRGIGSLSGDYSPYVLVDGVPMDLSLINSSDVESITVLKDAAASAIYGARAAYGVILVTTKKGKMNEKVKIEYSNNISFSSPIGLPHMANALIYATAFDQASVNAGLSPNFTPENYDRIRQYMAGEIKDETWLKPDGSDWYGNGIWSIAGNGNNDWLYLYYKDMVMRQKHDINISGGGEKNSFFVSAGYLDQPGELRYGDEYYKRYNITSSITSKPTKWLTFNLDTKYISDNSQEFNSGYGGGESGRAVMYHNFYRTNVFRPRYLPNGEFSDISNIDVLNGGKENVYGSNFIVSLGAAIEPLKNWITKIKYNFKNNGTRRNNNQETTYGHFPDGTAYVHMYPLSSYESTFSSDNYALYNIVSSYNKAINGHNFSIMGGFEHESDESYSLWGDKMNVITPLVPSISTATGAIYVTDTKSHWATSGFFGRFNYNFKEKYLFELNARYDGSSKFESKSRWGFFPSFSVGYNISKEDFWSSIEPYVTSLKIRGSWGSLGNQNVPNYLYLSTLGIGPNLGWIMGSERPVYTTAPGLISANLTWETSTTTNGGIDVSFLKGRLSTSFDLYSRITSKMFGPSEALPLTLGTSVPQSNNATLQTRGFEISVGWQDKIGANLSYNVRATLSDNVSTVTKYNNPTNTLSTWYEGAKLGDVWGLTTAGINQSDADASNGPDQSLFWPTWGAGDIQYKDLDGDKKITRGTYTVDNPGDYSKICNNLPHLVTGLSAGLEWKGFDFNMFWQGVLKREYAFQAGDMAFFGFNAQQWWGMNVFYKGGDTDVDYWRPANETNILGPNTNAYFPKPYLSTEDIKNRQLQTRFVQNAAYMRLKSLTIGYTLPSNITERIAISKARVYISGENLLTITPLTKLIDPEALVTDGTWGVGKLHPIRKVYSMGINVTF
jgi:TonB-linked SusC/RagA family outer membrane protein